MQIIITILHPIVTEMIHEDVDGWNESRSHCHLHERHPLSRQGMSCPSHFHLQLKHISSVPSSTPDQVPCSLKVRRSRQNR